MAVLFSGEWMRQLGKAWNADRDITTKLAEQNFNSVIAYGYIGEDRPRGILYVDRGMIVAADDYDNQDVNWDLRAGMSTWQQWITKGFGITNLSSSVVSGKLKFMKGDYHTLLRNARLAGPFLRHFELMKKVKTDYNYGD